MISAVQSLPSRVQDIDVVEVADGFVVYQPVRDRVHFVNHTAAVVLELCDGTKTDVQIASLIQRAYELPEAPETEVSECVAQLRSEGLVTDSPAAT